MLALAERSQPSSHRQDPFERVRGFIDEQIEGSHERELLTRIIESTRTFFQDTGVRHLLAETAHVEGTLLPGSMSIRKSEDRDDSPEVTYTFLHHRSERFADTTSLILHEGLQIGFDTKTHTLSSLRVAVDDPERGHSMSDSHNHLFAVKFSPEGIPRFIHSPRPSQDPSLLTRYHAYTHAYQESADVLKRMTTSVYLGLALEADHYTGSLTEDETELVHKLQTEPLANAYGDILMQNGYLPGSETPLTQNQLRAIAHRLTQFQEILGIPLSRRGFFGLTLTAASTVVLAVACGGDAPPSRRLANWSCRRRW